LSINSQSFQNFRNKRGEPAEPYPIAFRTGPAGATLTPARALTPENNRDAIAAMRQAIDESYSYHDLHKLDWDVLFEQATPKLEAAKNPKQFALEAARMLGRNQDMHLWMKVGPATIPTFTRKVQPNCSGPLLEKVVPQFIQHSGAVCTGMFPGGIGYVLIRSWPGEGGEQLEAAFSQLGQAGLKAMIVDVRPNGGGSELLAREYAGCFIDKPKVYAKHVIYEDGKFSEVYERSFGPNPGRPAFRGPVAVLSGRSVMSSCESFLLMMKQAPNCKLIGETSYGSSGNPQPVELGNGVTLFVPCWKDMRLDGTCFEGEGIAPDSEVKTQPKDFAQGDPVLEMALTWLRQETAQARPETSP
jgi:C-terminal processing protease CtpA/Prc